MQTCPYVYSPSLLLPGSLLVNMVMNVCLAMGIGLRPRANVGKLLRGASTTAFVTASKPLGNGRLR